MGPLEGCPRCEAPLERGRIVGQMMFLNWIPEGESAGVITLGKEHLATGSFVHPPAISAARCRSCGLGVFHTG